MGSTRAVLWAGALAFWTILPACGDEAPEPLPEDGVLVLELGGDNPPLRSSLQALGVDLEEPPAPAPEPLHEEQSPPGEMPASDPQPPRSRPEPEFFTVQLGKGETLWDLAVEHLGSGARWKELLECNGWTEAGARRLRAGTSVRIPRQ